MGKLLTFVVMVKRDCLHVDAVNAVISPTTLPNDFVNMPRLLAVITSCA